MADCASTTDIRHSSTIPHSALRTPHSARLRPPQFGLRTLLLVVAGCAVVLAILRLGWLSPIAIGVIAFLAVSVFLHVAGNAIGTRLREIGDKNGSLQEDPAPPVVRRPRPQDFAPATLLGQRRSLGWTIIVAVSVGITTGAIGGGLWTFSAARGHAGIIEVTFGVVAFAVLGGIASFATVGFAQVLFGAIFQAMRATATAAPSDRLIDSDS
jgi:hypothetical protein